MRVYPTRIAAVFILLVSCLLCVNFSGSQEPAPVKPGEVPKGVEVQARGPVHEAFATPLTEPKALPLHGKKPPLPIEELPPDEKPEGDVVWIGGYFSWD